MTRQEMIEILMREQLEWIREEVKAREPLGILELLRNGFTGYEKRSNEDLETEYSVVFYETFELTEKIHD